MPFDRERRHPDRREPQVSGFSWVAGCRGSVRPQLVALARPYLLADDLSLFDMRYVDLDRIAAPRQVTDTYLLALAKTHGGQFATFDRRLSTEAIEDGRRFLVQISTA